MEPINKLTDEQIEIIENFKILKPTHEGEINTFCDLKYLSDGLFRNTYRIRNVDLVVKVPKEDYDSLYHSQQEINAINKINKTAKLKPLRRYIPKLLYADKRHGIIVMPEYPAYGKQCWRVAEILGDLIVDLTGNYDHDIHTSNIRKDPYDERPILIDLGFFFGEN